MKVVNIERCPTCGQAINERSVSLTSTMVRALWQVYQHCRRTGRHEFDRHDIDPLIEKGTQYANFGYWKWWSSGMVYTPEGKASRGHWGFNVERLDKFFSGDLQVYGRVWVKGKGNERIYKTDLPLYIDEIPDIREFMDGDDYVILYGRPSHFPRPSRPDLPPVVRPAKTKKGTVYCPNDGSPLWKRIQTTPAGENSVSVKKVLVCTKCPYQEEAL